LGLAVHLENRILLYIGAALIAFGVFNLSIAHFVIAQEEQPREERSDVVDVMIQRLLAEIGPIVGGIVAIGIQFARK